MEGEFLTFIIYCKKAYIFFQKELANLKILWNTHNIRKTKNSLLPYGKPCNIYFMPEVFGGEDQLIEIADEEDYQVRISKYILKYF